MADSDHKPAARGKTPVAIPPVPEDVGKLPTRAAQIRALAGLGWERAVIAKALGVRYQQIANTLGPIKKSRASAKPKAAPAKPIKPAKLAKPAKPARTTRSTRAAAPEAAGPARPPEMPEPAPREHIPADEEFESVEESGPFPARHLWRLPGIIVFGAIAAFVLGALGLLALLRLVIRLAGLPGEDPLAGFARTLTAWLREILDYLQETDRIDDLPFPFSPLP